MRPTKDMVEPDSRSYSLSLFREIEHERKYPVGKGCDASLTYRECRSCQY